MNGNSDIGAIQINGFAHRDSILRLLLSVKNVNVIDVVREHHPQIMPTAARRVSAHPILKVK